MANAIESSGPECSVTQGRRLWYALGAGGLLLVILGGLAVWSSWHQQVLVLAEIERLGGQFWSDESVDPGWLKNFIGDGVMSGYAHGLCVNLSDTNVTDAGLAQIKVLTNLKCLLLRATQVTNAGLVHLKGQQALETLHLCDTQVTDAGLMHLKELTTLKSLDLSSSQVTDAGLMHLKGLPNLQTLVLASTQVTDAGLAHLQVSLPKCEIRKYEIQLLWAK